MLARPAHAEDAPTAAALVSTVPAKQGSIPDIVTAYGTAAPAQEGGQAISLPQDGRVGAIFVTQGERVHKGDRLLTFDLSATGMSTYQQAVTSLKITRSERAHTAQLLAQHLATRDQLAQADKSMEDAQATLDALTRQGADRPRTDVDAVFDAIVDSIPVAQGDRVAAGAPLMKLIRLDTKGGVNGLVVTVGVDPDFFARIKADQPASLHRFGIEGTIGGTVLRVDAVVNVRSHLVDVDIGVPEGSIIAGEAFGADIIVGALHGWLVPHDAVLNDEHGAYLFQVNAGSARRVGVQVLGTRDDTDAVTGKLDGTLPVVTEGATQIADGDTVRTAP